MLQYVVVGHYIPNDGQMMLQYVEVGHYIPNDGQMMLQYVELVTLFQMMDK